MKGMGQLFRQNTVHASPENGRRNSAMSVFLCLYVKWIFCQENRAVHLLIINVNVSCTTERFQFSRYEYCTEISHQSIKLLFVFNVKYFDK